MHKRTPALGVPNSPRRLWNPLYIDNHMLTVMVEAGLETKYNDFPQCDQWDVSLDFSLRPYETKTDSMKCKNGTWMQVERRASVTLIELVDPERSQVIQIQKQFTTPGLLTVSSFIVASDGTNEILTEETPLPLIFGTGEWQSSLAPDRWNSVDNRIWSVTNLSPFTVTVSLSFHLVRTAPLYID